LALAASNALAAPQGVTSAIAPSTSAPAGCSASYSGQFEITVVNATLTKRDTLQLTLNNGILKDAAGRTGYIAANYQFQFDGPPQTGAIYTSGFSLCGNGSLALGGSAIWYQCLSGSFYNLYDRSWAAQCSPIYIDAIGGASSVAATQAPDGQPAGTTVVTSVTQRTDGQPYATTVLVSQISDGQIQATTGVPVSQISDGQIQATSKAVPVSQQSDGQVYNSSPAAPVSQISDGQIQASPAKSAVPVSQISDGQPQASKGAPPPVSQISDGQIQATTGAPVSQISDGQIQATTGAPVSQISDGQVQATKGSAVPVSQISDGQIQATTAAPATTPAPPVSQKSDGQIIATPTKAAANITSYSAAAPSQVTVAGSPSMFQVAGSAAFAGVLAVVAALL
jgi:hypothetical protein